MCARAHAELRYALGDSLGKGDADGCARAVACLAAWAAEADDLAASDGKRDIMKAVFP